MSQSKSRWRAFRNHSLTLLNRKLEHKLLSYAAAASASGVSIMALAQPARAEIVYTPAHQTVPRTGELAIDLNNDGVADVTLNNSIHSCSRPHSCRIQLLYAAANAPNGVWATNIDSALALTAGQFVGPGDKFISGYARMDHCNVNTSSFYRSGAWFGMKNFYLAVSFSVTGETHYGWVRMSITPGEQCASVIHMTGYAYETVPGQAIPAGTMRGNEADGSDSRVNPTLGALALGSQRLLSRMPLF